MDHFRKGKEKHGGLRQGASGESRGCIMMIKILLWNVRGVNDTEKRKVIKGLLRSHQVNLVCLQENSKSLEGAGGVLVGTCGASKGTLMS